MKRWTIAAGESPRVYLINDGRDAVGEIVYTDTRRPEDARLIAAAPDLLAALKALTFTARTFRNVSQDEQMWTSIDEDALRSAFDAIAKAEGGA